MCQSNVDLRELMSFRTCQHEKCPTIDQKAAIRKPIYEVHVSNSQQNVPIVRYITLDITIKTFLIQAY